MSRYSHSKRSGWLSPQKKSVARRKSLPVLSEDLRVVVKVRNRVTVFPESIRSAVYAYAT
ncbi:hypothetical protein FT722_22770 [Shigella flexneri]|nr:hypothetical protein [Escherichia coli]EFW1845087.1 hypothetical protein [Shigella flexneri]EFW2330176.1 hypothetical protein [Shigella flexneri]EFW6645251.1 hypothetical protein [Shigella flexneri]EFW8049226.1 hypothetical protein [Shigella flexneri]